MRRLGRSRAELKRNICFYHQGGRDKKPRNSTRIRVRLMGTGDEDVVVPARQGSFVRSAWASEDGDLVVKVAERNYLHQRKLPVTSSTVGPDKQSSFPPSATAQEHHSCKTGRGTTASSRVSQSRGVLRVASGPPCAMTALQIAGQELLMADLIIIAYDTEATAEAARKKLLELQKEYLIELGDAVVAVRQTDGHVKLNQLVSLTAAGAASGGMWGSLMGLVFLNPLLGAAIGAGVGAISGRLTDIGIDDQFMKD